MPAPFGLSEGSTPDSNFADYFLSFKAVPNPHPDFPNYSGTWCPEHGLTRVDAMSQNFGNDPGCLVAIGLYRKVHGQLERIYGRCDRMEFDNSFAGDVWSAISIGEASYSSEWRADCGSRLDAGIQLIRLIVFGSAEYGQSAVALTYEFAGASVTLGAIDDRGFEAL